MGFTAPNGVESTQSSLTFEPRLLYKPHKMSVPGRFALCSKASGAKRVEQELFDLSRLDWVLSQVNRMPESHKSHFWISQATLAPWAVNRRISSIMLLNAVWVDIDMAHPPRSFDTTKLPPGRDPVLLAALLAQQMEDSALPSPSLIISTGGGLCAKYVFETSLPSVARARWQSVQQHFVSKIGALGDFGQRWPVDHTASDAARILRLVGSHNPRWDAPCRIVWGDGKPYDFDHLADCILPYSRQEVAEFKARLQEFKGWDQNRVMASSAGIRPGSGAKVLAADQDKERLMSDELIRSMWNARFEFGRAVLEARGGSQSGQRNNHFWPMANAIAWSCTSADSLTRELASLHHSLFKADGWTQGEAMSTAASVARRLKTGALYKMKTATFLDTLEVTKLELETFGEMLGTSRHNANRSTWNAGVMGFEPMRGLQSEEFIAETRRRQALAGARSARGRQTNHGADLREKAILLKNNGLTQSKIAAEIGASQQTVSRWLKCAD